MKRYIALLMLLAWSCDSQTTRFLHIAKVAALQLRAEKLMAVMAKEYAHKDVVTRVNLDVISRRSKYAPPIMTGRVNGLAFINNDESDHYIVMNSKLKNESPADQSHAILHELAHVYDPYFHDTQDIYAQLSLCDARSQRDIFTYYPYLREDAQACIKKLKAKGDIISGLQILSYEWYADWKASNVMKRVVPEEAQELRDKYEQLMGKGVESLNTPEYPPFEVLVKWLGEAPNDQNTPCG